MLPVSMCLYYNLDLYDCAPLLIAEHSEKQALFASSAVRKTEVWSKIATVMKAHGHHMNADACDEKFEEYVSTVNF